LQWVIPVKYVNQIHSTGAKIMSMVTNVEDAISVAKNGSDIVMVQGSEAGGHRSVFNNRSLDDYLSIKQRTQQRPLILSSGSSL
jgi:NAD(P)H-dependent flavin oxidoreductase YrpB (nitropropane dioxygenase family)